MAANDKRVTRVAQKLTVSEEERDAWDKTHLDDCRDYMSKLRMGTLSLSHSTMGEMRSRFEWLVQYAYRLFWKIEGKEEK